MTDKRPRRDFLRRNPFEAPYTLGFFYREKMRAIHRVAPDSGISTALEVGGGRSGLTRLLYPRTQVTNLDLDAAHASAPCNKEPGVTFVHGDATDLRFADSSFDLVTMFDLLEHVPDDVRAVQEAMRVLRPGGTLLVSTPHASWRYPYFRFLTPVCPTESELFQRWGHVRRGYSDTDLERLIGVPREARAAFISPATALCHDIAFSKLPRSVRRSLCAAISPLTWLGYWTHRPDGRGTETATRWRKPR